MQTTQTINIALPKKLVKKVDFVAKKEYRNRSELIREALRLYITQNETWQTIFNVGKKVAGSAKIKNEVQINKIVEEYRHDQ